MDNSVINFAKQVIKVHPKLNIDCLINDLEKSIRMIGVKVKYSEMKGIKKAVKKEDTSIKNVYGYARTDSKRNLEIVINGNIGSEEMRRVAIIHLFSRVLLNWNWNNSNDEPLSKDLTELYYSSGEEISEREYYIMQLTSEILLPIEDVKDVIESYQFMRSERVRKLLIKDTLARVFKVPEFIVESQLEKVKRMDGVSI